MLDDNVDQVLQRGSVPWVLGDVEDPLEQTLVFVIDQLVLRNKNTQIITKQTACILIHWFEIEAQFFNVYIFHLANSQHSSIVKQATTKVFNGYIFETMAD